MLLPYLCWDILTKKKKINKKLVDTWLLQSISDSDEMSNVILNYFWKPNYDILKDNIALVISQICHITNV